LGDAARRGPPQRAFLIGLARSEPDWSLAPCSHASELLAIRWRIQNLQQFRLKRPDEFDRQVRALERVLGGVRGVAGTVPCQMCGRVGSPCVSSALMTGTDRVGFIPQSRH
jgi:hypothetical protein